MILWDDPVFEELALNPAALGLVQHLIGTTCILSLFDGWVKGPGDARTVIHKDHHFDKTRPVMSPEPVGANINYLVTDYSAGDGVVTFVPGSHKWRRAPTPADVAEWTDKAVPIQARAGSIMLWGDLIWHGSTLRTNPGERLMVRAAYLRPFMQTQEAFRETVTREALARNPVRFAGLMDVYSSLPFGAQGADFERRAEDGSVISAYHSLFDREPAGDKVSPRPNYDYRAFDLAAHDATTKRRGRPIRAQP
jgi:ectoine hydroxylase-related dioxygenase (phytanoyl-CoA dioxygenase family)